MRRPTTTWPTYRWIEREFGAHAVVHVGKHGNLEWLPGKTLGMSASCGTDAAIGSMPLIYPFLVNDPGEGTQAKRRAHATIIDHLVPPMARAESYGDIARLEQLLDEYGNVSVMDPAKAPALHGEIWTLIQAAQLHQDLGLEERPGDDAFDEFVMHVDGWLCEIKDVQIRDGLHVLGQAPTETTWSTWCWPCCGPTRCSAVRSTACRDCASRSGSAEDVTDAEVDRIEAEATALVTWSRAWRPRTGTGGRVDDVTKNARGCPRSALRFAAARWCRGCGGPPTRSPRCCTPWTAATSRPDPPDLRCGAW